MKKLTFLFLFYLLSATVQAQSAHTLTTERNAYRAADAIVKQQVEFKDPGSSGRNLTWDFRLIQPIKEDYSLKYFLPNKKDSFNLCGMEHNTRYYYRQQRDSLQATGFENSLTYMKYTQPELRMRFPFAYGDTLYSTFQGVGEYCHRLPLNVKGYTRVIVDAEGDLLLPDWETVKKATRVRTLRHYTETGKDSMQMTLDTYSWYAAGIRYPVFESIKTTIQKTNDSVQLGTSPQSPSPSGEGRGEASEVTVFSTSFYYPPELQTSQIQTDSLSFSPPSEKSEGAASIFTEGQLMPNPVIDNLTIRYKLTRPAQIWFTVHTNGGIPVRSTSPQKLSEGYQETIVPMSGLITGTYSLYVHVDEMVMRMTVVKK